jgi:hypothetical protein
VNIGALGKRNNRKSKKKLNEVEFNIKSRNQHRREAPETGFLMLMELHSVAFFRILFRLSSLSAREARADTFFNLQ